MDIARGTVVFGLMAIAACGRLGFDPTRAADDGGAGDGGTRCAASDSPEVRLRSIGTSGPLQATRATIEMGSCHLTFTSPLAATVGLGDEIVFGGGVFYIRTIDSPTEIGTDRPAAKDHDAESVSIRRAHPSVTSWETAIEGNLVADDRAEVGIARRDGPLTGEASIEGSITDATHTITLVGFERHNGRLDTGVVFDGQGIDCHGLNVLDSFVTIENLELRRYNPDLACGPAAVVVGGQNVLVTNLLVYDFDTSVANASSAVRMSVIDGASATVRNVIAVRGKNGIRMPPNTPASSLVVENCSIHAMSETGVAQGTAGGAMTVRNTIATGALMAAFGNGGGTMVQQANISSDGTAAGPGSSTSIPATALFVSTVTGAEDLHLLAGAPALEAGLDLSASFVLDVDGEMRPRGPAWDIGADER